MCCSTKKTLGNKTISEYKRLIDSGMIPSEVIASLLVKKSRKSKIKNIFNLTGISQRVKRIFYKN